MNYRASTIRFASKIFLKNKLIDRCGTRKISVLCSLLKTLISVLSKKIIIIVTFVPQIVTEIQFSLRGESSPKKSSPIGMKYAKHAQFSVH